ncbi:MAG: hypothetical protein QF465_15080 [SAR202 cluster bacterium]|nr:hypothetical protein [SAR202 cluster bacterium]
MTALSVPDAGASTVIWSIWYTSSAVGGSDSVDNPSRTSNWISGGDPPRSAEAVNERMASPSPSISSDNRPSEVSFIVSDADATTDIPRGMGGSRGRSGDLEQAIVNTAMAIAAKVHLYTDINPGGRCGVSTLKIVLQNQGMAQANRGSSYARASAERHRRTSRNPPG